MKNNLWVEKWRPKSVDEYVFVDERQKQTIMQWIKNGMIPHLLLSGDPGTGKCLGYTQEVDVRIDTTHLTSEQLSKLEQYKI